MKKLSEYLVKIAGLKSFAAVLVIYLVYTIGVMDLGTQHISKLSGRKTEILDLQFTGYNMEKVNSLLSVYTPEARAFYVKFSLIADSVYPVVYTLLYIIAIAWALKAGQGQRLLSKQVHLLPIVTMLLDFAENLNIAAVVNCYPQQTLIQVQTASFFTVLKWGAVGLQTMLLLASVVYLLKVKLFLSKAK
jgi:hypothetical protein